MYTMEKTSELYDIEELPEGTFPLSFKRIDRYQREDPFLTENPKCAEYQKGYFRGGHNTIEILTHKE